VRRRSLLARAGGCVGLAAVAGCAGILGGGHRFSVGIGTVRVGGEPTRVLSVAPEEGSTLAKGARITVDCGYVTFEYATTMPHHDAFYLVYRPDRVKFEVARGLDDEGPVPGVDDLPFAVEAVTIDGRRGRERHELA
jgi:hypothetical protein